MPWPISISSHMKDTLILFIAFDHWRNECNRQVIVHLLCTLSIRCGSDYSSYIRAYMSIEHFSFHADSHHFHERISDTLKVDVRGKRLGCRRVNGAYVVLRVKLPTDGGNA